MCLISNRIKNNSSIIEDGEKPFGFFASYKYIGYVHNIQGQNGSETTEIYILTTKNTYDTLTKRDHDDIDNKNTVKLYYRIGNYFWLN